MVRSAGAQFTGHQRCKIDKKGRVALPAEFRRALEKLREDEDEAMSFFCMPSLEMTNLDCGAGNFLLRLQDLIADLEEEDAAAADAVELATIGRSRRQTVDPEGRTILPQEFIEIAGLDGEAMFVGRGSHFQIWNPALVQEKFEQAKVIARENRFNLRERRRRSRVSVE